MALTLYGVTRQQNGHTTITSLLWMEGYQNEATEYRWQSLLMLHAGRPERLLSMKLAEKCFLERQA